MVNKVKAGTGIVLATWLSLNSYLIEATEQEALELLKAEQKGKHRKQYILRAHARFNKMRAIRERSELLTK